MDFERLEPLTELPKTSLEAPGNALNRLREIASSPKIAALVLEAVGVDGAECLPVLNLKRP